MISSVLRSPVAIKMNIAIMRAFVQMRQMVIGYEELRQRIEELEINTNVQFSEIYQALTELSKKEDETKSRRPIGYLSYNQDNNGD
jgi:chaperonin cofactor prefoldin